MPRWAPRLFTTALLLLLGVVGGHAAEHEGWIKGLFHCSAVASCHGEADGVPCDNGGCHQHDQIDQPDLAPASVPSLDLPRALVAAPDFLQLSVRSSWMLSLLPDVPIAAAPAAPRPPSRLPLLI